MVLRTLSDKSFYIFKNLKRIICAIFLCNRKKGHHACLREKVHLFRYRAYFEGNLLRFVRARAHVRAQMTQIACAVGMRNAILRNHLN